MVPVTVIVFSVYASAVAVTVVRFAMKVSVKPPSLSGLSVCPSSVIVTKVVKIDVLVKRSVPDSVSCENEYRSINPTVYFRFKRRPWRIIWVGVYHAPK